MECRLINIFEDVDNELNYSASLIDNTIASVQVLNNLVDLSSILDANGQTEMILSATSIMEEFLETGSEDKNKIIR